MAWGRVSTHSSICHPQAENGSCCLGGQVMFQSFFLRSNFPDLLGVCFRLNEHGSPLGIMVKFMFLWPWLVIWCRVVFCWPFNLLILSLAFWSSWSNRANLCWDSVFSTYSFISQSQASSVFPCFYFQAALAVASFSQFLYKRHDRPFV